MKSYHKLEKKSVVEPSSKTRDIWIDKKTGDVYSTDKTHPEYVKLLADKKKEHKKLVAIRREQRKVATKKAKALKMAAEVGLKVSE